jgi:hypothetical protein
MWDLMLCLLVFPDVSKDRSAFMFSVRHWEKMAVRSFETSGAVTPVTRRYIPRDLLECSVTPQCQL